MSDTRIQYFLRETVARKLHEVQTDAFINTCHKGGNFFEGIGNVFLTPTRYLLGGRTVSKIDLSQSNPEFKSEVRFKYKGPSYFVYTAYAILLLIPSLILGSIFKGIGMLSSKSRQSNRLINASFFGHTARLAQPRPTLPAYSDEVYRSPIKADLHGDQGQKQFLDALESIFGILKPAGLPCWLDYGSALGVYRYEGMIPWDHDADIGVLHIDTPKMYELLKAGLDPEKYSITDWSVPSRPNSVFKVRINATGKQIDIYTYSYDSEKKTVQLNYAYDEALLTPAHMKKQYREEASAVRTEADMFPLSTGKFNGIECPVPRNLEKYLHGYYGTNLSSCREYNRETGAWERLDHEYYRDKNAGS